MSFQGQLRPEQVGAANALAPPSRLELKPPVPVLDQRLFSLVLDLGFAPLLFEGPLPLALLARPFRLVLGRQPRRYLLGASV